ncbi:hypothetical protein A3742_01375 [Oleiphilus sp. HI0071]|uniref:hypothetical protein n=1 Tax=unclassified Oleiphilus TaxID=2631174 RepID=UPI0007C27F06|nr:MULTISPECIES: hypothetical protein [unclassified Oleiphilus]KZY74890.1 hypothetical protein A3737_01085 [Oleiphilus sp. HI0065]KZY82027.1 hypothetical protein A3742_01375 [Oleiphilus sp. HI0071]KZY91157.1 hypothetical protein A3744_04630 [Oleiphilus sp. HI0073]KZZ42179.1 hypothetical protein A3758_06275 [Oleiphilus sp. HI0118]KZZ60374.1 hypothetical protein A3760_05795 [Oleiphilus sp. HI0122]KZZ64822.1 hypothetical protein A3765_06585 [Oleiphilus sp. HI0130]KZZ81984.1 hypothetical protein
MLTVINSDKANTNSNTAGDAMMETNQMESTKGAELLLSYMLWEQKFEQDAHEVFEDPIEVFLTAQGEKPLTLV